MEISVTDTTTSPDDVGVELPLIEIDVAMFKEEVGPEPITIVVGFELEADVLELKALLLDGDELELSVALNITLLELENPLEEDDDVVLDGATLELEGVLLELESLVEELRTPADDAEDVDEVTAEKLAVVTDDTALVVDTAAVVVAT